MKRPQCWAVVPAAGSGSRFSDSENKLLVKLGGEPVLLRTVKALMAAEYIDGVHVATSADQIEPYRALLAAAGFAKPFAVVEGGVTRRESVYKGLESLPLEAALVAVHDAARPLIEPALIENAIRTLVEESMLGVLLALPVTDTVKRGGDNAEAIETVDRSALWCAQTPQIFWTEILLKAHRKVSPETTVTDDAQLLELAGLSPVKLLKGSVRNIKITRPEDLKLAEWLLQET